MKVYHIHGIRRQTVVFAETPEEAMAQVIEQGLAHVWETWQAVEVPLPRGYCILYDPQLSSMEQAELPLSLDEPEPDKPHTITRSGVKVYHDWRDNIVVDPEAPPLIWKADRDLFGANTGVPGWPYLASENSEDALSWNLFRTLEKAGRLDVVARAWAWRTTSRSSIGTSPGTRLIRCLRSRKPWTGSSRGARSEAITKPRPTSSSTASATW